MGLGIEVLAHVQVAAQPYAGLARGPGRTVRRSRRPPPGERLLDGERGLVVGGCDLDHGQARLCDMRFVDRPIGNETAAAGGTARTGESWTDYSQLSGITAGGKTYDLVHAGTDNSERTKLGSTWFHHTAIGLTSTTTNGIDTGFIREPAGTLTP
ncbi:hypothetical protein SPURM210S_03725 [Streptomyces purpurascens]|nr:hypothetical protein GCM10010303_79870 [Streptomyces purpurascens]